MNLQALKQALQTYSIIAPEDDEAGSGEAHIAHLNRLASAVATEWIGSDEERYTALRLIQEHIDQLRVVLTTAQETVMSHLQHMHRSKKSVNQYNKMQKS